MERLYALPKYVPQTNYLCVPEIINFSYENAAIPCKPDHTPKGNSAWLKWNNIIQSFISFQLCVN